MTPYGSAAAGLAIVFSRIFALVWFLLLAVIALEWALG